MADMDRVRACEALVKVLDQLAATYPQPEGWPIRLTATADGVTHVVHVDSETANFLTCRAAESVARGRALRAAS
ncbi:hypothetical protein [Streptomyces griseosporeus]|uniref:hypothetical protein n=1 Tax=Streptomyces griseosporeus TaxID=1910 RepID=UPI0036FA2DBF